MKKTKAIFAAVVFSVGALGFSVGSPDEKYEFHVTFDEMKDAFLGNSEKKDDVKISDSVSSAKTTPEPQKLDIEKIRNLAETGNSNFQFVLGRCYARGEGVEQSWEQAAHWYTLSAEKGDKRAQNNLGCIYFDAYEALRDYEKAIYWFEKSAAQNCDYAYLNLGDMYRLGRGVPQDYKKAMECYTKAEKLGAKEAPYCIGYMYKNGLGVGKSDKKALKYFKKSAELGYQVAKDEIEK